MPSAASRAAAASLALPRSRRPTAASCSASRPRSPAPAAQLGIQMNARCAHLLRRASTPQGGINGAQIELRTLDDGYEPDRCKANTEKFIKDDVFALFGYVGTPTCLAALPLVGGRKIPFFGPFTGAEALRDPLATTSVFHVRASLLRRDRADRQAADLARAEEDRGLLPERQPTARPVSTA